MSAYDQRCHTCQKLIPVGTVYLTARAVVRDGKHAPAGAVFCTSDDPALVSACVTNYQPPATEAVKE